MILGGALITQYKAEEEAEPARFRNFQNRFLRKLTGSVEYRGVVPEEDDSVFSYGEPVEPSVSFCAIPPPFFLTFLAKSYILVRI